MELSKTAKLMKSDKYKDRFKAEYYQLKIRLEKLNNLINNEKEGKLPFELSCPLSLLEEQRDAMSTYLRILEERAEIEEVSLCEEK